MRFVVEEIIRARFVIWVLKFFFYEVHMLEIKHVRVKYQVHRARFTAQLYWRII